MGTEILNLFEGVFTNILSNCLDTKHLSISEKQRINSSKEEINEWMQNFIISHDGSVLTSDYFATYLRRFSPLETIFSNAVSVNNSIPKDQLITKQLESLKTIIPENQSLTVEDEHVFIDLLAGLYDRINTFFSNTLTINQKFISSKINIEKNEILLSTEKNAEAIVDKIESTGKQYAQKMDDFLEVLRLNAPLCDQNIIWDVYDLLSHEIMQGRIIEVRKLLPLLEKKNKSLEYGMKFLIQVLSNDTLTNTSINEVDVAVENDRIYSDLIAKTIYILLVRNDMNSLHNIGRRNGDLYAIANKLYHSDFDSFFQVNKKRNNGILYYKFKCEKNYPGYEWLIKRICIIGILKMINANASDSILELISSPDNIVDKIVLYERKAVELLTGSSHDTNEARELIKALDDLEDYVDCLSNKLREKYYLAYLQCQIIINPEKSLTYFEGLPEEIKNNNKLVVYKLQAEMNNGSVDENKLIDACVKGREYWLLNNYLIYLVNTNKNPEHAKEVIENYRFVIDVNLPVFLIYAQLLAHIDGREIALNLLDRYKGKYGNTLDYWQIRLSINYVENELDAAAAKWLNDEILPMFPEVSENFIDLLVEHEKYEFALQGIQRLESQVDLSLNTTKLKAISLLKTKHEIEAYEVFKNLFNNGVTTDEIVYYLLALSINNKRELPDGVIEIARTSNNSQVLSLAARHFCQSGMFRDAYDLTRRALFRMPSNESGIFSQFISIHSALAESSAEVDRSDVNTVVFLKSISNETKLTVCIHPAGELPNDNYNWENSVHVYRDTAVQNGLFRKQKGEQVKFESEQYIIEMIETLDAYLFRLSMGKLLQSGHAKAITMKEAEDGSIDFQNIQQQIKDILGDNLKNTRWLDNYRDASSLPVPFYCCVHSGRFTYSNLISLMIKDSTIMYRELSSTDNKMTNGYILSAAALIALFHIGYTPRADDNSIMITDTLKRVINEDAEIAIAEYGKDTVAAMRMENDQLKLLEASDAEKNSIIEQAVKLKDYASKFSAVKNSEDLILGDEATINIKEVLGIADHDAISFAKKKGLTLVTAEELVNVICTFNGINVPCICIADFLVNTCEKWEELTDFILKMMVYRFCIPITVNTVKFLDRAFSEGTVEEKGKILEIWNNILNKPKDDSMYKNVLASHFHTIISQGTEEELKASPIWTNLMIEVLVYLGYKIELFVTDDGLIIPKLSKSEHKANSVE